MKKMIGLCKIGCSTLLCALYIPGCAQMRMESPVQPVDCRTCHVITLASGAKDFSAIYSAPLSHHPANVKYPVNLKQYPDFNQPSQQRSDISFFDSNVNGQPDTDEIILFKEQEVLKVECSSCHRPHDNVSTAQTGLPQNFYLRRDNLSSGLCLTCHRK